MNANRKAHRFFHSLLPACAALLFFARVPLVYAEPLFILPLDEGVVTQKLDGTVQRDFTLSAQMRTLPHCTTKRREGKTRSTCSAPY